MKKDREGIGKARRSLVRAIVLLRKRVEKENLPYYRVAAERLIEEKCEDAEAIEHTLDGLLDFAALGLGREDFEKLNRYYAAMHPRNARAYTRYYEDATK